MASWTHGHYERHHKKRQPAYNESAGYNGECFGGLLFSFRFDSLLFVAFRFDFLYLFVDERRHGWFDEYFTGTGAGIVAAVRVRRSIYGYTIHGAIVNVVVTRGVLLRRFGGRTRGRDVHQGDVSRGSGLQVAFNFGCFFEKIESFSRYATFLFGIQTVGGVA